MSRQPVTPIESVRRLLDRAESLARSNCRDDACRMYVRAVALDRTHTASLTYAEYLARIERYDEAIARLQSIARHAQRNGDRRLCQIAAANLAAVLRMGGHWAESRVQHQLAERFIATSVTDERQRTDVAVDFLNRANDALVIGNTWLAGQLVRRGLLALDSPEVCPTERADYIATLGVIACIEGRTSAAFRHLLCAYRLHRAACDDPGEANDLVNMAEVCHVCGRREACLRFLERALRRYRRIGAVESANRITRELSNLERRTGGTGFHPELN